MYKTNISISLPVKTLVEIDHARASESRSSYIGKLLSASITAGNPQQMKQDDKEIE